MRIVLAAVAAVCLVAAPADAFRIRGSNVAVVAPPAQSIASITPATASFVGGAGSANRTAFTVTVNMLPPTPAFAGSLSLGGADAALFKLSGNDVIACSPPQTPCGDVAAGVTYNVTVTATQSGVTPASQAVAVTATVPGAATFLATDTFKEITGSNQAANWPLQRGFVFKYGAVASNEHVEIRVASGATCNGTLLDYQWDEIATRTENGADGSWKHAVYTVRLPAVSANQYVSLAFCKVAGAYTPGSSAITLADLCAAHPLAMDFNNVKNQNGSTRDSGSATWSLCSYISTTGRESPIQYANGQIRKGWIIRGEPVYATSGNKDPQLYVMAYVDVFSVPGATGTIDRIKHVVRIANAWMQVTSGSRGVAGATDCNGGLCPAGFAGDAQMVSYTPKLRDGATAIVDYDALFSQTVADPTVPTNTVFANTSSAGSGTRLHFATGIVPGASYGAFVTDVTNPSRLAAGCYVTDPNDPLAGSLGFGLSCSASSVLSGDQIKFETYWTQLKAQNNPANSDGTAFFSDSSYFQSNQSSGQHLYYTGSCFNYSTPGTPPAGMTNNTQYYAVPIGWQEQPFAGDRFQLFTDPQAYSGSGIQSAYLVNVTSRGSGAQNLQFCVNHRKHQSWYTADINGKSRWSGSIPTEPFENTFDQGAFTGERLYWEQTGIVPPINLSNAAEWAAGSFPEFEYPFATHQYWPGGVTLAMAGASGGEHSYIGILAAWSSRWWLDQDIAHVRNTRIFALDGESFPVTTLLSEATGRIPPINNGPPAVNGTGSGASYPVLGPPYNDLTASVASGTLGWQRVAQPLINVPAFGGSTKWWFGAWATGIANDHQAAYNYYPFILFGDHHFLDGVYMQAQRSGTIEFDYSTSPGVGSTIERLPNRLFTFPAASGTPSAGKTFHGILYFGSVFQGGPRASAWMLRSLALGAGLGPDGWPERTLIQDYMKENLYYWNAMKAHKDCHADLSPAPGSWSNSPWAGIGNYQNQGFMDAYNIMANYVSLMVANNQMAKEQMAGPYLASAKSRFGTSGWPISTPPIYGGGFFYHIVENTVQSSFGKCRADIIPADNFISSHGTADPNTIMDTSNGLWGQFQSCPTCGHGFTLTPGDKLRLLMTSSAHIDDSTELSTGLVAAHPNYGPAELDPTKWYCIVDIDNTAGTFRLAPPTGTFPNECATHGPTFTSYSGMVPTGGGDRDQLYFQSSLPPGFTEATTWAFIHFVDWRLQSTVYDPNPTYVWWAAKGVCSLVSAGFTAATPYCNQGLTVAVPVSALGEESSFDWDHTVIPPRAP